MITNAHMQRAGLGELAGQVVASAEVVDIGRLCFHLNTTLLFHLLRAAPVSSSLKLSSRI